jgi:HSP20 family protein
MTNIMRYDPFDLVEGVLKSVLRPGYESALEQRGAFAARSIPMDVAENENAYLVWADLPGVRKEDVEVAIDGNVLTLSAQVKQEKAVDQGQGKETVLLSERPAGAISRRIQFAQEIDDANAKAEYRDGVLWLTLPKKAAAQRKRLTIH